MPEGFNLLTCNILKSDEGCVEILDTVLSEHRLARLLFLTFFFQSCNVIADHLCQRIVMLYSVVLLCTTFSIEYDFLSNI